MGVCFPDGGGETGSDCGFGPAACQSGLCIKKLSGNVCTQTCDDATPCPETWGCVEQETLDGQTLMVCLPPELLGF